MIAAGIGFNSINGGWYGVERQSSSSAHGKNEEHRKWEARYKCALLFLSCHNISIIELLQNFIQPTLNVVFWDLESALIFHKNLGLFVVLKFNNILLTTYI